MAALLVEAKGVPQRYRPSRPVSIKPRRSAQPSTIAGGVSDTVARVRWSGILLTSHDSYTAIARCCSPTGDVFHAIREEAGKVYPKHALRNRVVEDTESKDDWQTVFQGHRDEVGGSLMTLWLGHSKWLSSLSEPIPFIGHKHSRENGIIRQVEDRNCKLPDVGEPNTEVKAACRRRLRSKLAQ